MNTNMIHQKYQCSSQFGTSTYRAALRSKGQVATPAFAPALIYNEETLWS